MGSIGLGFAIPINQARRTAQQLIKSGKATYPILGISIDMNFTGQGALIGNTQISITADGPAAKAGLRPGDVITHFAGKTINSGDELIVAVRSHAVGERVNITFLRNGKSSEVSLVLVASNN